MSRLPVAATACVLAAAAVYGIVMGTLDAVGRRLWTPR